MISKLRRRMSFVSEEDGFTLIELMIVIAVLGVLAGIAIPRFSGVTDKADIASAESDLRNLQTAAEMYIAEHSTTPNSITSLSGYIDDAESDDYYNNNYEFNDDGNGDYKIETSEEVGGKTVFVTPGGIGTN
ncbi:competence type IV pilus major pilin ComGC [Acetohalobium arabaticum]|uniref:Tfp pilus assembly protein PilE n=1 Tax=Acetohalobium arabaticum (strain ATCC 49924 / DSM 5501 / Z-7288) TaxID=574087 RepID=D9QRY5_ACEAZ|nr:prepilin-type N-terminal cleavage/methylation domain-containing protein [Acetohalobium arabaticum]ADL13276.1 Tfp pilus assembly protein PilE [Acetohalobium arabaticum DSM 5501]